MGIGELDAEGIVSLDGVFATSAGSGQNGLLSSGLQCLPTAEVGTVFIVTLTIGDVDEFVSLSLTDHLGNLSVCGWLMMDGEDFVFPYGKEAVIALDAPFLGNTISSAGNLEKESFVTLGDAVERGACILRLGRSRMESWCVFSCDAVHIGKIDQKGLIALKERFSLQGLYRLAGQELSRCWAAQA